MDTIKRISILLKVVVIVIGLVVLAILIIFPLNEGRAANLDLFSIYFDPFILYGYIVSTAFFVALYKTFKLIGNIGQHKLYSSNSAKALKSIKHCAIVLSISIVLAGLNIILFHNKEEDPAGFVALCIATAFVSIAVAVASAVFENLLQNALKQKAVKDLIE